MPSGRRLQSVLDNFLGTFASRNTEFGGYLLLGVIARDLAAAEWDLLAPATHGDVPMEVARRIAHEKFREQLRKAGFHQVAAATLEITRGAWQEPAGGKRGMFELTLRARAFSAEGAPFESERRLLVAPHDPAYERRSAHSQTPKWWRWLLS